MTKQEFVDAVADRAGMTKRDAAKAVDAVLDTITDDAEETRRGHLHGLREVLDLGSRRSHGRQPAHGRESP